MIGFYNYAVVLTYISLISGTIGIHFAITGHPLIAIICLMISGFCDMFDGKVARTKNRTEFEKRYGIQIDSLVDLVSFGVLPAMIGYGLGLNTTQGMIIICLYILAAMIRLAYFNCLSEEVNRFNGFIGLPVTSAALFFPFTYIFNKVLNENFYYLYAGVMIVLMVLFVSKIKIKKPNDTKLFIITLIGILVLSILVILKFKGKI